MSGARRELEAARTRRDVARAEFDARLDRLRGDPETQTLGGRLVDRLGQDARHGMDYALGIASESKGVAAATATALALWFMRGPIIAWIGEFRSAGTETNDEINETDVPEEVTPNA